MTDPYAERRLPAAAVSVKIHSAVAARALCFIEEAFRSAARFDVSNGLTAVVSVGVGENYLSHGTTVEFFTPRAGHPDWYEDLERFKIGDIDVLRR